MDKRDRFKRKHIHLTIKQDDAFKKLAKDTGLTFAELIRRAIDEYLKRLEK